MFYPNLLLVYVLVIAAFMSAAGASVSNVKTSAYLTEYYEIRIVELMALKKVFEQSDPSSFTFGTSKGETKVQINETSVKERQIHIATFMKDRAFRATFYFDNEKNVIVRRIEHH